MCLLCTVSVYVCTCIMQQGTNLNSNIIFCETKHHGGYPWHCNHVHQVTYISFLVLHPFHPVSTAKNASMYVHTCGHVHEPSYVFCVCN